MDLHISKQGLQKYMQNRDVSCPQKGYLWTTDHRVQLPICLSRQGFANLTPSTLVQQFRKTAERIPDSHALSYKVNGQWNSITYKQYFDDSLRFGKALLHANINPFKAVNINGFNSPQWMISFLGSTFIRCLPVGVYTTNGPDACRYIAQHSQCQCVVIQNNNYLKKYLQILPSLPQIKAVIIYGQTNLPSLPPQYKQKIYLWKDFLKLGDTYVSKTQNRNIFKLMKDQQPGNCCTIVYTSGTTGPPKGVLLSHDNYIYNVKCVFQKNDVSSIQKRLLSYLPLSHVAGQISDIVGPIIIGGQVYFADPTALQGKLIDYLRDVRPTLFFSVPRVWQKIEEKMKLMASQNGFIKQKIAKWAKSIGVEGTYAQLNNKPLPFGWSIAKSIVYNNVKKALGIDKVVFCIFGAAPLSPTIRQYFTSLNIFIGSTFGMSQCAGPECITQPSNYQKFDSEFFKQAGYPIEGTQIKIDNPDKDGNGQICFRGRNRFMGYFKNIEQTIKTIDKQGYVHSGDVGKLDEKRNLFITGRIKQLIITAGGQNVAPVLIENVIKQQLPFIGNCVVIGDQKKFLSALLSLKVEPGSNILTKQCAQQLQTLGIIAKTIQEAKKDPKLRDEIQKGLAQSNKKAISRAQYIIKFIILNDDFSPENGMMTPTMKLKRKQINKKYNKQIQSLYEEQAKL